MVERLDDTRPYGDFVPPSLITTLVDAFAPYVTTSLFHNEVFSDEQLATLRENAERERRKREKKVKRIEKKVLSVVSKKQLQFLMDETHHCPDY